MENNKPKLISIIITVVALVGIVVLLVIAKKQQVASQHAAATTPDASASVSLCYVLNAPTKSGSKDAAYLKITTPDGGKTITGELGTAPAEKDKLIGTLTGSIANVNGAAVFDGMYTNSGEGMNNVNEQLIRLDETEAQIGYGETVKKADGTYGYKDKAAVTYSLTLPAVDCSQYDSLKAAAFN